MGVEYGLYNRTEKSFLWLGKTTGEGFQRSAESVSKFVADAACRGCEPLSIYSDMGDPPDWEDDGWTEHDAMTFPGTKCEETGGDLHKEPIMADTLVPISETDVTVGRTVWILADGGYMVKKTIEQVLCPSDPWKAFCADDGCRYGLDGTYKECNRD